MNTALYRGSLVRLTAEDPQVMAEALSRWSLDPEYSRLLDSAPTHFWSAKKFKEWIEKDLDSPSPTSVFFSIRTLAEDTLIGFIALDEIFWERRDAFVAIGIGERQCWSKGYGTDAMRLILRYAFLELNLHRVSLTVFSANPRAIRSYEKCGFVHEGVQRQFLRRDGAYWDLAYMGILRQEWDALQATPKEE